MEPGSGDILFLLEPYQPSADEKAIIGDGNGWEVAAQVEDGKAVSDEEVHRRTCRIDRDSFSAQEDSADANHMGGMGGMGGGMGSMGSGRMLTQMPYSLDD